MILSKLYDKSIRASSHQNPPFGAELTRFLESGSSG
jgi:hypothetical protein